MRVTIFFVMALFLLASCGSDDSSSGASGSTTYSLSKPAIDCDGSNCVE